MGPIKGVFKTEIIKQQALSLHPLILMVLCEMTAWAWAQGLPVVITETVTNEAQDAQFNRISPSHREGRAFDMSTRGWDEARINEFMSVFSKKYQSIAAIGLKTGKPELIVRHDTGHGDHFHVQINRSYAINLPTLPIGG